MSELAKESGDVWVSLERSLEMRIVLNIHRRRAPKHHTDDARRRDAALRDSANCACDAPAELEK